MKKGTIYIDMWQDVFVFLGSTKRNEFLCYCLRGNGKSVWKTGRFEKVCASKRGRLADWIKQNKPEEIK